MARFIQTLAWIIAITSAAKAEEVITLKFASINVPPFVYIDNDTKQVAGQTVALLQEKAKTCRAKVEFIVTPAWNRSLNMALQMEADGLLPTTFTPDRERLFAFSKQPIAHLEPALIVRKDSGVVTAPSFSNLRGKRIAIRAKSVINTQLLNDLKSNGVNIIERANTFSSLDALLKGQVDMMIATPSAIDYYLGKDTVAARLKVLKPSLQTSPQYLAVNKKHFQTGDAKIEPLRCMLG